MDHPDNVSHHLLSRDLFERIRAPFVTSVLARSLLAEKALTEVRTILFLPRQRSNVMTA